MGASELAVEEDPENYFSLRIIVCPISEGF